MIEITPTNKFQVSSFVNENLPVKINVYNDVYEIDSVVSVYILSSDLKLSDSSSTPLNGQLITLDIESGNTTFHIFSNISSYCTNTDVNPSTINVENLQYNKDTQLAIKITALSHTIENNPIVLNIDNAKYSSFNLEKELSVNILPNLLKFTGVRSVENNIIHKNTNITCDYLVGSEQLYFYKDEIQYVTNTNNEYGIMFYLENKDPIPFYSNISCMLMNEADVSEYATIVETSPKNFTLTAKKANDEILSAIFKTADGMSAIFPFIVWADVDVSDPSKIINIQHGDNVLKNDIGEYVYSIQDKLDESNFIRIQSVIPLEFEFSEIG